MPLRNMQTVKMPKPVRHKTRGLILCALAAIAALALSASISLQPAIAGEERSLSFYNTHTKENITITYKRDGRYIPSAMAELNRFMRDWRRNVETRMDPELIDLIWELTQELDAREPIQLISGYRSQETNNMLRRAGRRVARRSMHIKGQAADVYFPGVPLDRLRNSALVREVGGVGYYPRSGTNGFVHVDTGRVRHWPRMSQTQVARIFREHRERPRQQQPSEERTPVYLAQNSNGQDREMARPQANPLRPDGVPIEERSFPLPLDKPVMVASAEPAPQPAPAAAPAPQVVTASLAPTPETSAPALAPQGGVTFNPVVPDAGTVPQAQAGRSLIFFPLAIMRREQPAASLTQNVAYQMPDAQQVVTMRGSYDDGPGDEPLLLANVQPAATPLRQLTATELQRLASQVVNRDGKGALLMSQHAQPVPTVDDKGGMLDRPETIIDLIGGNDTTPPDLEQPNIVMGIDDALQAPGDASAEVPLSVALQ